MRRVNCKTCGVKNEKLAFLSANTKYTLRFAMQIGGLCRAMTIQDVARRMHLDWRAVKELDKIYMREQLARAGHPAPRVIGIDEVSIKKRQTYRIVVSDLEAKRAIWFGGNGRSEQDMDQFYGFLGQENAGKIRLAVMWKPFRNMAREHAPQAAILFDKFHVLRHLGEALDKIRKSEYARITGPERKFIKGQKYVLLSHKQNLTPEGRHSLKLLLKANKRLNTAYLLRESFDQLWDYTSEAWARRFFDNWKAQFRWQRLKPYEAAVCTTNMPGYSSRKGQVIREIGEKLMAMRPWYGTSLMASAGALGTAAGIYDYYTVATGIDGTGGVELIIASSLLMVFGALVVMALGRGFLAGIFLLLLLLDVIGTVVAGYFLESPMTIGAMALAALGWLLHMSSAGRNA